MADIRIKDLPGNASPNANQFVATDLSATEKLTIQDLVDTGAPIASQAEAEAGVQATKRMTPLTTKQAIDQFALVPANIGATVQAYDADLTAIADLTSAADKMPYATGAGTWALADLTAAGRAILDDADASAQRTTLGLGTAAVEDATAFATAAQGATADTAVQPNTSPTLTNLSVSGAAGTARSLFLQTSAVNRWIVRATATAESGSNVGSDLEIVRRDDAGANLGSPLSINRSTGKTTFSTKPQVGASDVLIASDIGRDVGDVLAYEDFGGFPTIFIDDRFILRKETPTLTDVYNVGILRDVSALTGGTAGFVNTALSVDTTVDAVDSFEWGFLSTLTVDGAGGGEHVAGYFQGIKNADNSLWSLCTEIRDFTTNPTTGSLGIEVGLFVTGTDNNSLRHGIDISIGSADDGTGTNIASSGIRIGPSLGDPDRAQMKNGIEIKGRATVGLNLSELEPSYSPLAINLAELQEIAFDGNASGVYTRSLRYETGFLVYETASGQAVTISDAGQIVSSAGVYTTELNVNGSAGAARNLFFKTSGTNRWIVRANSTAESGSNVGSDLEIVRRDDAGANLGTPLSIKRSTGVVTLSNPLTIGSSQVVGTRITGWGAATGTATRTTFATSTVTTELLAQRVKALIDDLITHGLIGA